MKIREQNELIRIDYDNPGDHEEPGEMRLVGFFYSDWRKCFKIQEKNVGRYHTGSWNTIGTIESPQSAEAFIHGYRNSEQMQPLLAVVQDLVNETTRRY